MSMAGRGRKQHTRGARLLKALSEVGRWPPRGGSGRERACMARVAKRGLSRRRASTTPRSRHESTCASSSDPRPRDPLLAREADGGRNGGRGEGSEAEAPVHGASGHAAASLALLGAQAGDLVDDDERQGNAVAAQEAEGRDDEHRGRIRRPRVHDAEEHQGKDDGPHHHREVDVSVVQAATPIRREAAAYVRDGEDAEQDLLIPMAGAEGERLPAWDGGDQPRVADRREGQAEEDDQLVTPDLAPDRTNARARIGAGALRLPRVVAAHPVLEQARALLVLPQLPGILRHGQRHEHLVAADAHEDRRERHDEVEARRIGDVRRHQRLRDVPVEDRDERPQPDADLQALLHLRRVHGAQGQQSGIQVTRGDGTESDENIQCCQQSGSRHREPTEGEDAGQADKLAPEAKEDP
mmetsp:Transcript_109330/g.304111  ORF Transcript_109330/g.304111 Transcript_109330/m.304111 type:complete len:411 (-) Transcript_109330:94-1326(-)